MTKLTMEDFDLGYGSERWVTYGKDRKFIARFKYGSPGACARHHVKAIIALMTKEELEESLADRSIDYASKRWVSTILDERGHIHYNIIKAAKVYGVSPRFLKNNPSYGFDLARKAAA